MTGNYEDNFQYLGPTLREQLQSPNRLTTQAERPYLRLFGGQNQRALLNNFMARELCCGFSPLTNSTNLMTGIGARLQEILVTKICGKARVEGPKSFTDESGEGVDLKELKAKRDFLKGFQVYTALERAFNFSLSTGRGVIVVDYLPKNKRKKINLRVFDIFRSRLSYNYGELTQADLYIELEEETFNQYTVVERRYYKNDKPYQKHILIKTEWDKSDADTQGRNIEFEKLKDVPQDVLERFKDYSLYKEVPLDDKYGDSLGVFKIDNSLYNPLFPYSNVPASQYLFLIDRIVAQDTSFTSREVDKELGRGRVLIKAHQRNMFGVGDIRLDDGNVATALANQIVANTVTQPSAIFEQYPGMGMQEQAPQLVQFAIRADQWKIDNEDHTGEICAAYGISVLDYDPRLLQTGQRTDDEINAMTDITIATATKKREIANEELDDMLQVIGSLLGATEGDEIFIRWSIQILLNPTKNADLVGKQLANGTISQREAIKRENPDYSKEEIDELYEEIKGEREAAQANRINEEFNQF